MRRQKLLTKEILQKVPGIYEQDGKGFDSIVYAKFFTPNSGGTWYMTEYDPENKMCFGFVEGIDKEFGYFSIKEFEEINARFYANPGPSVKDIWIERDAYFQPTRLGDLVKEVA